MMATDGSLQFLFLESAAHSLQTHVTITGDPRSSQKAQCPRSSPDLGQMVMSHTPVLHLTRLLPDRCRSRSVCQLRRRFTAVTLSSPNSSEKQVNITKLQHKQRTINRASVCVSAVY